jgi:predicted DNA-binding transcriptional regulator AlpA
MTDGALGNVQRRLMTMAEVEAEFGFNVSTQRYWRYKGTGPRSFRAGRRVLYEVAEINRWINEQAARQTGGAA